MTDADQDSLELLVAGRSSAGRDDTLWWGEADSKILLIVVGGDTAEAETAIDEVRRFLDEGADDDPAAKLRDAITSSVTRHKLASFAVALIDDTEMWVGRAGGCGCYLISEGEVREVTSEGTDIAEVHGPYALDPDDVVLLCSEALSDELSNEEITAAVEDDDLEAACEDVMELAGSSVTAIVARVWQDPAVAAMLVVEDEEPLESEPDEDAPLVEAEEATAVEPEPIVTAIQAPMFEEEGAIEPSPVEEDDTEPAMVGAADVELPMVEAADLGTPVAQATPVAKRVFAGAVAPPQEPLNRRPFVIGFSALAAVLTAVVIGTIAVGALDGGDPNDPAVAVVTSPAAASASAEPTVAALTTTPAATVAPTPVPTAEPTVEVIGPTGGPTTCADGSPAVEYVVQDADILINIASAYGVQWEDIVACDGAIRDPQSLDVGDVLSVPTQ